MIEASPTAELAPRLSPAGPGMHQVVVVGNGMASHALCERLVRNGAVGRLRLVVLGDEPRPAYDRVRLTEFLAGRTADSLQLASADWYAQHGIEHHTGVRITGIDRLHRTVAAADGRTFPYHHLVLATGSRPVLPEIPGAHLPGVFVYRTLDDLERLHTWSKGRHTAAVVGGGLLGLEAAHALQGLGLAAHVLERSPRLLSRQLDSDAADALRREVERLGVTVHLTRRTESIRSADDGRLILHFSDDQELSVDLVVFAAGVRPCDELARDCGLTLGPAGGVHVDDLLAADDPRIWACGECASHRGVVYGLIGPCLAMADVLAENLNALTLGQSFPARFESVRQATLLKLPGVRAAALGKPWGEVAGGHRLVYRDGSVCRSLLVEDRRVASAAAVGDWPEQERLRQAVESNERLSNRCFQRFERTGSLWHAGDGASVVDWPADSTVCGCLKIHHGRLTEALSSGAATAEALTAATGAGSACGSCLPWLRELAGQVPTAGRRAPWARALGGAAWAAAAGLIALCITGWFLSAGVVDSIDAPWFALDSLWRDPLVRKWTGGGLTVVFFASLVLSLRKRWGLLQFGGYAFWRAVHGWLGAACVGGFLLHAGGRLGHNLTLVLGCLFIALIVLGVAVGLAASLESRATGAWAVRIRRWRPRLAWLHAGLFLPAPILILFHAVSVFYF